jgi:EAL domain-containing protein (putative c-di-GMP-specific phosphodiesterase class I)
MAHHARDYRVNGEPLPVAINVSPLSLLRRDLPDQLAQIVEEAGLACTRVTVEVTENRLMDYGPDVLETMARLRIKGFGLSVDDFGTGASNIDPAAVSVH